MLQISFTGKPGAGECAALGERVLICLQAICIIKVRASEAVRSGSIFQLMFMGSPHPPFPLLQVHPSSLLKCLLAFHLSYRHRAAAFQRPSNQLPHYKRSSLYSKSLLLYHFWWFHFSGQTLTDTNGHLFVLLEVNLEF